MNAAPPCILTINGGSSSIRFAVYEAGETLRRRLEWEDRSHRFERHELRRQRCRAEHRRSLGALPPPTTAPR